jgi:hypothetical protein
MTCDSNKTSTRVAWHVHSVPLIVLAASCTLLLLGLYLHPNPSGYGTHKQLGLPACGFLNFNRIPCATCGWTTAFTHAVHGELIRAFATQPAGALFAVAVAALAIVSGYDLAMGAPMALFWRWLWRPRHLLLLGAIVLAAWLYKIITV